MTRLFWFQSIKFTWAHFFMIRVVLCEDIFWEAVTAKTCGQILKLLQVFWELKLIILAVHRTIESLFMMNIDFGGEKK